MAGRDLDATPGYNAQMNHVFRADCTDVVDLDLKRRWHRFRTHNTPQHCNHVQ